MNKYVMCLLLFFMFTSPDITGKQSYTNEWRFDNVVGTTLKFKNGRLFNTHLNELKYIGQVSNGGKAPYLIFSGRDCNECDANISIYIHSPDNGKLLIGDGKNTYQYPGTELDFETHKMDYESKAFYGQVLKGTSGVIWYEKRILENKKWGDFIFFVEIKNGIKKELQLKDNRLLNETLALLKKGDCKEISGMNYISEP